MLWLILLQAADTPPDIQLDLRANVREVRIERRGEASLEVRGGEGSEVRVEAPRTEGRRRLRNVEVRVRADARVADPAARRQQEPPAPD